MVVLVTCKRKEDLIKNEGAIVHNIIHQFFRRSRADNSRVGCGIWPKFELIQAFMHFLITCKNNDDSIKMKELEFSRRSRAANSAVYSPIWPNFELVRDVMVVLITYKYEEDPIKNEGARVFTVHYTSFFQTLKGR